MAANSATRQIDVSSVDRRLDQAQAFARQALYRFTSLCFLDPHCGAWERLQDLRNSELLLDAAKLLREAACAHCELAQGENSPEFLLPQNVLSRLPATAQALNDQYEATFGLLVSSTCPPYETEYLNSKFVFQRSNALADIAGFYRAFGLRPSQEHPERHDHIALELEFMGYLAGLEAHAAAKQSATWRQRRAICRNAQRRFLAEHLAWWTPAFAHLLARNFPGGFYASAAEFLAALVPTERHLLQVPAPRVGMAAPSSIDRPEECEGCLVADHLT